MKKFIYSKSWILSLVMALLAFSGCEFDEPFPDPSADFAIWSLNVETNAYEQVMEPYSLSRGMSYDFIIEGTGQQFVLWFGVEGDPGSNSPSGSNFNDRGENHYSKGIVAVDMKASNKYLAEGEYNVVLVASSYSYSEDKYKESLTTKTVTVTAP